MSALRFIRTDTISGTVSTVNIENIFSNNFAVYKMVFTNITTDTTGQVFSARVIDSGDTVQSESEYYYATREMKSNAGFAEDRGTNQDNMQSIIGRQGDSDKGGATMLHIFNPFDDTEFTNVHSQFVGMSGSDARSFWGGHVYRKEMRMTGLQIINNNNNFTGGKITTYGYASV